jgi:hypothetical protein
MAFTFDSNNYLLVDVAAGGGSGSNAAAGPTGSAVPTSADYIGFNVGGNLVGVSAGNPLPITGSISATNPSVGTTGATAPTSATEIGFISSGNLVGVSTSNPIPVAQQGTVTISGSVSVSNFPGTQLISGTVTALDTGAVTTAAPTYTTGTNQQLSLNTSGGLRVDGSGVTQPISGTVTATVASTTVTNTVAENLTQVGGSTIALGQALAAASLPVVLTAAQISTLTPLSTVTVIQPTAANLNATVSGTITANAGTGTLNVSVQNASLPVTQSGTWSVTATQASGANLHVDVDNFPATQPISGTVAVSNFPATQPVSGTVAVTQSTSPWVVQDSLVETNTTSIATSDATTATNTTAIAANQVLYDAVIAQNTRNDSKFLEVLESMLTQLKILNMNLASSMPSAYVDADNDVLDLIPTIN